MGAKGSGKSTVCAIRLSDALPSELTPFLPPAPPWLEQFISLISGSNLAIGGGLRLGTDVVHISGGFNLDDHPVVLIEIPEFDNVIRSDTDILKIIAAFLEKSYVRLRLGL
jgi:hypothetical protein